MNCFNSILIGICLLALSGCQYQSPAIAPVEGVVLFNGLPARASISTQLLGESGTKTGRPSVTDTRTDGTFNMQYTDQQSGVLVGDQEVTISVYPHERAEGEFQFNQRFRPVKVAKFQRTVSAGSNNHWKFFLTF